MYRPDDHLLWDFWTARHGDTTHLFYLRAPRGLADPELRHAQATVGHATSRDLVDWDDRGPALAPGPPGAWDDLAIWTGSVAPVPAAEGGGFAMLYTGIALAERGKVQRVGLARSDDLATWCKHPANPVIEADPRWYMGPCAEDNDELAWRDPYLARDPSGAGWVAYITARVRGGDAVGAGCVAFARSDDLIDWRVGPPAACPGCFLHMEIPQPWRHDSRFFLLFNVIARCVGPDAPIAPRTGTFYLTSHRADGGFWWGGTLVAGRTNDRYGVKLLDRPDGRTTALAWRGYQPDGSFAGALSDPLEVRFGPYGTLTVG